LLAAALTATCTGFLPARPAAAATAEEAAIVAGINEVRSGLNLRPLELHPELERKADDWAAHLATLGTLVHSVFPDGITVRWSSLAENVASDTTLEHAEAGLLASPVHQKNIINPAMTHIGVGIAAAGGRIYIVEEFMELRTTTTSTGAAAPRPSAKPAPSSAASAPKAVVTPKAAPVRSLPAAPEPPAAPAAAAEPPATAPDAASGGPGTEPAAAPPSTSTAGAPPPALRTVAISNPGSVPPPTTDVPATAWPAGALVAVGTSKLIRRSGRRKSQEPSPVGGEGP
jgi:hypothetical protein